MFARLTGTYFLRLETALHEDWGRRVGVTFSDPAEEFASDMLLFHLYLWKLEWQMLHFRLWLMPNIYFMWQSQLTTCPLSPRSHVGPRQPISSPQWSQSKEEQTLSPQKDPVCIFTCQATAYDNTFPTYPLLKPVSELSSQSNMSKPAWAIFPNTEPLQQSETSSKRQNHLVSKTKPPAFISPSLHLPQCLPGIHGSTSRLSSTCPCCMAPVLRQGSVPRQWRQKIKNNRESTQSNVHPRMRQN